MVASISEFGRWALAFWLTGHVPRTTPWST